MATQTLSKAHKLCSQTSIEQLFAAGHNRKASSALAYPLRAVWFPRQGYDAHSGPPVKFLISVPKKRLRRAVDRVLMRRRVREAYRLQRIQLIPEKTEAHLALAFIYVADKTVDYQRIYAAVAKILRKIFADQSAIQKSDA